MLLTNEDNMNLMARYSDNYFDLVLTDPPYKFEVHGRGIAQKRDYLKNGFNPMGQLFHGCKKGGSDTFIMGPDRPL